MQNDMTNQLDFKENEIVLYQPNDTIHLELQLVPFWNILLPTGKFTGLSSTI